MIALRARSCTAASEAVCPLPAATLRVDQQSNTRASPAASTAAAALPTIPEQSAELQSCTHTWPTTSPNTTPSLKSLNRSTLRLGWLVLASTSDSEGNEGASELIQARIDGPSRGEVAVAVEEGRGRDMARVVQARGVCGLRWEGVL